MGEIHKGVGIQCCEVQGLERGYHRGGIQCTCAARLRAGVGVQVAATPEEALMAGTYLPAPPPPMVRPCPPLMHQPRGGPDGRYLPALPHHGTPLAPPHGSTQRRQVLIAGAGSILSMQCHISGPVINLRLQCGRRCLRYMKYFAMWQAMRGLDLRWHWGRKK